MSQGLCYVLGFVVAVTAVTAASKKQKPSLLPYNDEPCGVQYREHHCLNLVCKRKHVIFDLDVVGKHNYMNCTGKTGGLITDTAHCFWQPSCSIQFPRQRMLLDLFTDDGAPGDCVYQLPDAIQVSRMQCAKLKEIVDICSGKKLKKQGIIRSHEDYPWNNPRNETNSVTCSLRYNRRSKSPKDMYITVLHVDQVDCDSLTINGEAVNESKTYSFNSSVTITFTKCPQDAAPGPGLQFILCFKENKPGKKLADVCQEISRKSEKKLSIKTAGPLTKECFSEKKKKKKERVCCCGQYSCKEQLKKASEFKKELLKSAYEWKTCKTELFPCECELKKQGTG